MKSRGRIYRAPMGRVLGLWLWVLAAGVATAQPAASIVVEGNRRIEAATIRSHFPAGRPLDAAAIDAALKALLATGLFRDVRIRQSDRGLIVTVVEAAIINRVAFEGNKRIKDAQLTAELQSKVRGALLRPTVQADVQRIVEIYRRSGRYDVHVEPKIVELPDNRVDLVFEIAEGARTTVKDIRFTGNQAFGAARLKNVVRTTETNLLSFIKNNDLYDPDRIEADRDLLRRFYLSKGYADVQIIAAQTEFDPAKKGFVVSFGIEEGPLYRFGAVEVVSNLRDVDPERLRAVLKARAGAVYNAEEVEKTTENLTIELSKRGYAFAQVRPRGERRAQARQIDVVFAVDNGPRAYIERIDIRGNSRTRDAVIRREFDVAEGDPYNKVLIDRAERRLKNLGYFKTIKITNAPGSAPDRVVVSVEVEDQLTGELSISGGYSTTGGLLAEVGIGERNLLGQGLAAKTSVTYGQYVRGFDLTFTQPYLLGSRVSLSPELFYRENLVSTYQSYGTETYGAALRVGTPLTEELGVQWRYSIYNQSLSLAAALMDCSPSNPPPGCYANGEASLPVKQAVLNGPAWVSLTGSTITYDTLDNRRNPTSGVHAELSQDFAGLGGAVKFIRTTSDVRYYHEITPDLVAVTRLQGGYVTPWGGQPLPMLSGFFGGPQLVRGFAPSGFGPRDLTPGTTMDNVGGSRYVATTGELQAPVPNLPSDAGLKVAVFADAGTVRGYSGQTTFPALPGQSLRIADSKVIRSSVGAGLIWDSPFGPLRVDYAQPLTKASYDVVQRFRFGAGPF